ncbi:hypothetical protein FHT87_005202 [Rhizobium sp. BK316]|uniref:hypothetical protein n=1 Tax=Rhizobium sp. BK316 TaxID=2587053 RepID=UPI00161F9FD5|nr:hypothetical protein [Rhizobium sp. BK316]MBB3411249.1 hypothetical protein [Rhizobium sp. BK316]
MSNFLLAFGGASIFVTFFVLAACRVYGRCAREEIDEAALEGDLTAYVKHLNSTDAA